MNDPVAQLELYRTCFNIALIVTLVSLALAIFLFFKLDIRGVMKRRGGRSQRRAVKQIEQRSLETGRLIADELLNTGSSEGKTGETTGGKTGRTGRGRKSGRIGKGAKSGQTNAPAPVQTLELNQGRYGQTEQVAASASQAMVSATEALEYPRYEPGQAAAAIGFVIKERIIAIHTNEMIEI